MRISNVRRSWNALKASPNWFRTVVLLALVQLIPIIGAIAAYGFLYRWARDAAWGLETPLPNKIGDLNPMLKTGAIYFVISFCWSLVLSLIGTALGQVPVIGLALSLLCSVIMFLLYPFLQVMSMRAVLYDSFEPAIQVGQAWDMIKRDPKGLVPLLIISLVVGVVAAIIVMIMAVLMVLSAVLVAALVDNFGASLYGFPIIFILLSILAFIVFMAIIMLVSSVANILIARTTAYWIAQFKPSTWGPSSEYLPLEQSPPPF